ncbi:kit ligand a isoform X3 [Narcine bancroftii]|uniref:kit ligand a isoform X3 n=1 Tax=Narcine bancroftii TaxID=1343680 RepID=UPI003831D5AA
MKEANTLINSVICLQLFLLNIFGGPICKTGNPVTDDIKRIDELVGNLPSDYKIQIRYISKVPNVTNTCWLHLTVPEMSFSLDALLEKFARNSSNYLIIENLHRILYGIHNCLSEDGKDYVDESEFNCEKSNLEPKQYFNYFSEIIDVFQSAEDSSPCDSEVVCRMEEPDSEQPIKEAKRFKGDCMSCAMILDYLPTIMITTGCILTITILACLIIYAHKKRRRNRRSRSYQADIECEPDRTDNEQEVQFIAENQDSCT